MRRRTSLNGIWKWVFDQYESVLRSHLGFVSATAKKHVDTIFPPDWRMMRIPCSWNLAAPELLHYDGALLFQRQFSYRRPPRNRRVFLCFEASYYQTRVWLNGAEIGMHNGGFTPFEFDITEHLRTRNTLHVWVDASRRAEWVPCCLTDWYNYGGIFRPVFLEERPRDAIRHFFVFYRGGKVHVRIETTGRRMGHAILEIPELSVRQDLKVYNRRCRAAITCQPILWSPAKPKCYRVRCLYGNDVIEEHIGFRTIEARAGRIWLNGQPLKLKGVCLHEEAAPRGRALTAADRRLIFDTARALGLNFLRLAHYPHAREMALEADRRGILLWEEIPVYWYIQFTNPQTYHDAANQLTELIRRDCNRASVAMWSVANETPEYYENRTRFISDLAVLARKLDPSRPITAAIFKRNENQKITVADPLAASLDILGVNQYGGWYAGTWDDLKHFANIHYPDKPVIISEFGADAKKGLHGRGKFTEDYQRALYRHTLTAIRQNPYIQGVTPWILFDFRSPNRINIHQNGFNRKGLVDADRKRRKLAFYEYQRWHF